MRKNIDYTGRGGKNIERVIIKGMNCSINPHLSSFILKKNT